MKRFLLHAVTLLVLGTATAALAPTGHAQGHHTQSPPAPQAEITFDQADLIDPARLDALHARIETAARDVCREALQGDPLRPVTLRACIQDTTERAMEQLTDHRTTVLATNGMVPHR